jgi:hypothetical protein
MIASECIYCISERLKKGYMPEIPLKKTERPAAENEKTSEESLKTLKGSRRECV